VDAPKKSRLRVVRFQPVVDPGLVWLLERLLSAAKHGEIVSMIGATVNSDGTTGTIFSVPEDGYPIVLLGELEATKAKLIEQIQI